MKIAFIGQKGIPTRQGGIEKHVEELAVRLSDRDFDVFVYARPHYTGSRARDYRGVNIVNLPSINTKHLDAISHTLFASIHALFQDYDIIHYHGVGPALLSFIPRIFKPNSKIVVTFHCLDRQHQKWNRLAKFALKLGEKAACIFPHETITISKILKKYCRYNLKTETNYIPNGVSTNTAGGSTILQELGLVPQQYILSVSRLVKHKGLSTLVQAYNQLKTDKKLVIVGDGANSSEYVKELAVLAQANPNIILAGQKSGTALTALYQNAYLFVQPSETEGLSIALLEAMAYGVPAIISNIEENQEATAELALEFVNKSPEDLKRKLAYALDNEEIILALANRALARVKQEYDWDNIVKDTSKLYQTLTAENLELVLTEVK